MADFAKFTVVYTVGATSGRAKVERFDPFSGNAAAVESGYALLGVTMTAADEDEGLAVLRSGYVRGLTSSHITGWEPDAGALLWCDADGSVTTSRPTTGLQVCVGAYAGGGVADVHVQMVPSIGELSYVKREIPAEFDVLIWSETSGAYVPRQLDHNADLANLAAGDPHPQYSLTGNLAATFLFMGGD